MKISEKKRLIGILLIPIVMISMLLVHMQPVLAASGSYGTPRTGTVYDDNGIVIKITGSEVKYSDYKVLFYVENNRDEDITVQIRDFSVNGYMLRSTCSADVSARKKTNDEISISESELEKNGISTIQEMEFKYVIHTGTYVDGKFEYTPTITLLFDPVSHTHVFDSGVVTVEPTCTQNGVKTYTCSCGETKTESISATGHYYGAWEVIVEPTATSEGQKERVCNVCGDVETETIPFEKHTHEYGSWKVTTEPTTYSTGTKTRTCTVCGYTETETIPKVEPDTGIQMLRLFNPYSGEHFYTSNAVEKETLVKSGWQYEGVAWTSPNSSNTPVFRLYNSNSGEHHYTVSAGEKDCLVDIGWDYEGIGWYSDDSQGVVLYRLYNPNATGQYAPGAHHYTRDMNEVNHLASLGWNYEGIGWYGL